MTVKTIMQSTRQDKSYIFHRNSFASDPKQQEKEEIPQIAKALLLLTGLWTPFESKLHLYTIQTYRKT